MKDQHTVERIIRANPVPDESLLNKDETDSSDLFSSIVRRRDSMLTPTRRPPLAPRERIPWYRKPQTVFVAAALLVAAVMVPVLLFRGSDSEMAEEPTTSLPASTVPDTAQTTTPAPGQTSTTVAAPTPAVFDELLVGDHMAMKTEMVTGPDGSPAIISYYESVEAWFDGAPSEAGMEIVRCLDPECLEFDTVDIPYSKWPAAGWPPLEFAAFLPDGSPVFLGEASPVGATEDNPAIDTLASLLVCSDPDCTDMEVAPLEDPPADPDFIVHGPHVLIGENGFPVLYFVSGAPPGQPSVKQIICADRLCADRQVNTLIEDSYLGSLATDADGRLILTYSAEQAVVCEDLTCSTGTTTVDPDTLTDVELLWSGWPPVPSVADYLEDSSARICLDPWCVQQLQVPLEREPGLGVPAGKVETWRDTDGLLVLLYATFPVDQDEGDPIPVDMIVAKCTDAACSSTTSHPIAAPVTAEDVAAGRWWDSDGAFSTWLNDDGVPLIAYGTIDGVHLIRCADALCAPPD